MDLVEFLTARLDEDETVARETRWHEQFVFGTDRWFASHGNAITSMAPHRAVAEVAAKRIIITEFEECRDEAPVGDRYTGQLEALDRVIRTMGVVHADHPDYCQEWKP